MTIPKDIRMKIAMAKGYLQKNDLPLALETIAIALREIRSQNSYSAHAVEKAINPLLQKLNSILAPIIGPKPFSLRYHHGKEFPLASVLREFAQLLREQGLKQKEIIEIHQRRQYLMQKGENFLQAGEMDRGCAFLERAVHEFYQDVEFIIHISEILIAYEQFSAATKILSENLIHHSRKKILYLKAIDAAISMQNYPQIEHLCLLTLQQFGKDPQILGRLAHIYAQTGQVDLARDYAHEVIDYNEAHAKEAD